MSSKDTKKDSSDKNTTKSPRDSKDSKGSKKEGGESPRAGSRSASPSRSARSASPRSQKSRATSTRSLQRERRSANKIYRCPPTPPPDDIWQMEKGFVLDGEACSSLSDDYSKTNPKLAPVIRPYNSQSDRSVNSYFRFYGVDRTLRKTEQEYPGTSIDGGYADRFHRKGPVFQYLARRNMHGAGRSFESVNGHSEFLSDVREVYSYNGPFGFRRNTPWLRATPSPFGTGRSPVC